VEAGDVLMVTLRPYQQEAKDAIQVEWDRGARKTLLVLPTGTGKTIVFSKLIEDQVTLGERVLVLAHRGELLDQAADKLAMSTGLMCAVEKAQETSLDSWYRVVVGSVQTLMRDSRLEQFDSNHFDTIIVDEAHHAISDSYQKVLQYFGNAKVLGVTATPDRGDLRNLGSYFDSLAYEYSLPRAIRDGYLCRIKAITIPLRIDISGVGMSQGDYKAGELGTALDPYLEAIADEMVKVCSDRKTIAFLPLIKTSKKFCDILNSRGFRAAEVNGNSQDRTDILQDFADNRYNVLCNSMLLTEGYDQPDVDCIVMLRPTKIRSLYAQCVGRGTRLAPGKEHLLLPDFLWMTSRHELCHPASLICENEEVARRMTANLEETPGVDVDIEEAAETAMQDVVAAREEALAKKLEEMRHRKRKLVDPLQFEMSIQAEDLSSYVPAFGWEMGPPSTKQIQALEKAGIFPDEIDNAGKATLLLDRLSKRRENGLTTPKQIRYLESKGFRHVGTWQFEQARRLIDRIAGNGWRIPHDITPSSYLPPVDAQTSWAG
jgi:superfamily II DNA or RNA helicase